ncbi:lactonase family protein [Sphingomonas sanguinis]|uniref:lactonase family protein n=1 Tax=Sphingomonas sanguinis TaxID=33051 RepID=UPI001C564084|nr:lactonase family protein [Sphingomonas sanguinis]QXT37263.1 lactonase family protein [Sphingomonas sanguinis]
MTTTRREVMAGAIAATGLGVAGEPLLARRPGRDRLIAGTYANEGGKGLYPIVDGRVGAPVTGIVNASYGVGGGPDGTFYLLREQADGRVAAYGPDWRSRGGASTGGADPCHVAIDRASACLAVANYSSGSVAFYRLDRQTGAPGEPQLFQHRGTGPNTERQAGPHAHWVGFSPDRRWLHSVDLGADAIFAYRFDPVARTLTDQRIAWQAPAGVGPRHMVRHPTLPRAYLACELRPKLFVLDALPDGRFRDAGEHALLLEGTKGPSYAAHIAIDRAGRTLYVSNRGANSITVFALDARGEPRVVQHVPTGGDWPRFFLLREERGEMLVANERSGTVNAFRIGKDGRLTPTERSIAIPGVVFLAEV